MVGCDVVDLPGHLAYHLANFIHLHICVIYLPTRAVYLTTYLVRNAISGREAKLPLLVQKFLSSKCLLVIWMSVSAACPTVF
jgi:hypothetical protein